MAHFWVDSLEADRTCTCVRNKTLTCSREHFILVCKIFSLFFPLFLELIANQLLSDKQKSEKVSLRSNVQCPRLFNIQFHLFLFLVCLSVLVQFPFLYTLPSLFHVFKCAWLLQRRLDKQGDPYSESPLISISNLIKWRIQDMSQPISHRLRGKHAWNWLIWKQQAQVHWALIACRHHACCINNNINSLRVHGPEADLSLIDL